MGNSHGPERKKELKARTKNIQLVYSGPGEGEKRYLDQNSPLKRKDLGFKPDRSGK